MDEVTLRDYFAAKALQALIRNEPVDWEDMSLADIKEHRGSLAVQAYQFADDMLEVRVYKLKGRI